MADLCDFQAVGRLMELKRPGSLKKSKDYNWTVGHFVAAYGSGAHLSQLIEKYPGIFYYVTKDNKTLLEIAFEYNNISTASVLLRRLALD